MLLTMISRSSSITYSLTCAPDLLPSKKSTHALESIKTINLRDEVDYIIIKIINIINIIITTIYA